MKGLHKSAVAQRNILHFIVNMMHIKYVRNGNQSKFKKYFLEVQKMAINLNSIGKTRRWNFQEIKIP